MVQPCCERTYKKYITTANGVDTGIIKEIYGPTAIVEEREDTTSELGIWIHSRENRYPKHSFVILGDKETNLCTCECHNSDFDVIH